MQSHRGIAPYFCSAALFFNPLPSLKYSAHIPSACVCYVPWSAIGPVLLTPLLGSFCQTGAPGADSPPLRHWKESALVSADPSARASPLHQTNGHDDRTGSVSRMDGKRGSARQTHLEHQSTGPASLASTFNSSYFDYGDVSVEYNAGQDWPGRFNHSHGEQVVRWSGSDCVGRIWPSSKHLFNVTSELEDSPSYQSPVQCNIAEQDLRNRERHCSSPLTPPQPCSGTAAPALDSYSYSEQNGCSSAPPHLDDGRSSPLPTRSSRFQKLPTARPLSDTNPNQGAYSRGQENRPTLSRAERMAALERRMLANGLSAPGRPRTSPGQKRKGHPGDPHVGGVQMNDCCTTSGSESSESEAEFNRGSSPQMSGNPVETSFASSIPRSKFSFGSLQLDEEEDEEGCYVLSDEDGGQIFNC